MQKTALSIKEGCVDHVLAPFLQVVGVIGDDALHKQR